jgi:HlyD family secretion protein
VKKRIVITGFVVLLVGVSALVYYAHQRSVNGAMYYSGTCEATQSNLSFQASGRVAAVHADEGRAVRKGDVLAELDVSELRARYDQAAANLERSLRVREQLETVLSIYRSTLPEEVKRAEANEAVARNTHGDAWKNYERYEQLFRDGVVAEKERDSVRLAYDNASSRLKEARAALEQAGSNLQKIEATLKDIGAAKAQIDHARASLDQARIQLGYARLEAPFDGIVTSRNVEPGEVVSPGREAMTIADLARIELKIYVEEAVIGRVKPGQKVDVRIDTFPGRSFSGQVSYISPEAEFTPKIIQTKKERVKLVYMVKIILDNPDLALKAGMPADAYLQ